MRLRIHIRVHPQADRRDFAHARRHFVQAFQLGGRLDVEAQNTGIQSHAHFRNRLSHAREHDFARITAGSEHTLQFASGHDVETRAQASEYIQDRQVGIGFHRITDQMFPALQRIGELAQVIRQRGARIHIAGGAEPRRDLSQ